MGKHIFVCARCAGIYTGGFIVSLMLLCGMAIKTRKMKLLLISSVIIISDVLLYNAGFYKYYNLLSFFTGLFFGISVYLVFISEISIFINKRRRDE